VDKIKSSIVECVRPEASISNICAS
jgi:hypothetical protein